MSPAQNIAIVSFRLKYFLIALSVAASGLVLLFLSSILIDRSYNWLKLLLEQVSTALLIGAISGLLYEYFIRREFVKLTSEQTLQLSHEIANLGIEAKQRSVQLHARIDGSEAFRSIGLSGAMEDVAKFDFSDIVNSSRKLTIVLNDGRTWVGSNFGSLAKRLQDSMKETRFVLLHPKAPVLAVHALKVGSDTASVAGKVEETIRMLTEAAKPNGKLEIYGHQLYNTFSLFLADEVAIMTLYFNSSVRTSPPVLIFEDTGPESTYRKLSTDVDALIRGSERF